MSKNQSAPIFSSVPAFVKGQLWKFDLRCIRIEHVGRLLVEHRGVSPDTKPQRSPKRMMSIRALQEFLAANNAVLVS